MGPGFMAYRIFSCFISLSASYAKTLCREQHEGDLRDGAWRNCTVQIGGLAIQGADAFNEALGPTFQEYLTQVLSPKYGLEFEAIPLNFDDNFNYVGGRQLDFIYSNPAAYTCLMVEFKLTTVASLMNFRKGNALSRFAGVIFTQANSSFNSIQDLRRARVEAVSISGLGAMQLQQAELLKHGLNVMTDVQRLTFTANQNKIVADVQSGAADVGFVRTDMIDRSVAKCKTKWEYFKVINEIPDEDFPFKRSTDFTPEWPIGALEHVPNDIKKFLGQSLMGLDRDDPSPLLSAPGLNGSFKTWVPPMNYLELLGMLENIGYYDPAQRRCLRNSDVYQAINCPAGYVKQSAAAAFCPDCVDGYTCLCNPCSKLNSPEIVLKAEEITTSWPGAIDVERVRNMSLFSESCARMELCTTVAVGQNMRWTVLDQIGMDNRIKINAPLLTSVEILTSFDGSWQAMTMQNVTVDGLQTQIFSLSATADKAGTHILQVRINGEQADVSPAVLNHIDAPLKLLNCPPGHQADGDTGLCKACPAGSAGPGGSEQCKFCDPGTMQPLEGMALCQVCSVGTSAPLSGSRECQLCAPGRSTRGKAGRTECDSCEPGQMAQLNGSDRCTPCPRGFYSTEEGAKECIQCSSGQTTRDLGSRNASLCGCPQGEYFALGQAGSRKCKGCLVPGTECPGFGMNPLVVEGFYMSPTAALDAWDLDVWKCTSAKACPGQKNVSDPICADRLEGINCAVCPDGTTKIGNACYDCDESSGVAVIPLIAVSTWLALGVYHFLAENLKDRGGDTVKVLGPVVVGVSLTYFQALGIYNQLSFLWPSEFESLLSASRFMLFQPEAMQVPCVIKMTITNAYLLPLFAPLLLVAASFLWIPASKALHVLTCGIVMPFTREGILNSTGKVLLGLYIGIVTVTLSLLDCYRSPNGQATVRSYPFAVCAGTEYGALVPFAIFGILVYVIGLLSLFMWMQHVAPSRSSDPAFRRASRFLFFKFTPECWWFGLVVLLRSLAIAMVTIISPDRGYVQFLLMIVILVLGLLCQVHYKPYKDRFANIIETWIMVLLLLILSVGSWFIDPRFAEEDPTTAGTLSTVLTVLFSVSILILASGFVMAVALSLLPTALLQHYELLPDPERTQDGIGQLKRILIGSKPEDLDDLVSKLSWQDVKNIIAVCCLFRMELTSTVSLASFAGRGRRLPLRQKTFEKFAAVSTGAVVPAPSDEPPSLAPDKLDDVGDLNPVMPDR